LSGSIIDVSGRFPLVSAPADYGKSPLINNWLETLDYPTAWISLDEHDDLGAFLSYFLAAIQRMFPRAAQDTHTLLAAPEKVTAKRHQAEIDAMRSEYVLVYEVDGEQSVALAR